jgi:twitching motility protein PilI
MANREALRELQTRLASRLQAARSEGVSASWLAVRTGGANYLFPLAQSGEIFPLANLQPVPYARSWFKGVVNLRGGLYGVVDLAGFIGNWSKPPQRTEQVLAESSVVTLNAAMEVNCALLVESLAGLRNADAFTASQPADDDAPPYFGHRFTDAQGVSWQEINLRSLSQLPAFLGISA